MPFIGYEVVLRQFSGKERQRFVIKNADEEVAKSQLKAFLDTLTPKKDWMVDIRRLPEEAEEKSEVLSGAMSFPAEACD